MLCITLHSLVYIFVQYHKEARDTQDLLKRLDTEVSQKYNPEFKDVYQMEGLIRELDVSLDLHAVHTTKFFYSNQLCVTLVYLGPVQGLGPF